MSNYAHGQIASVSKRRSKFNLHHNVKTSFNVGDLVPFMVQEVYPGDSFKVETTQMNRLVSAFIKAPMDNLMLDTFYFFVPNRLVMDKWQSLQGENQQTQWKNPEDVTVPQFQYTSSVNNEAGNISDYMGIPIKIPLGSNGSDTISALPFRAYALIYNEWFRDQNNQDYVHIKTDQTIESGNKNPFGPNNYTGKVAKINKVHDYFSSCLPGPQKGDPVDINLTGDAQVKTGARHFVPNATPLEWQVARNPNDDGINPTASTLRYKPLFPGISSFPGQLNNVLYNETETGGFGGSGPVTAPANLYADMSTVNAININDLRFAFQLQRLLEKDARGGTRYVETILNHFGVVSPDSRLQRPEFLGGNRNAININQVVQTSETATTPQGSIAGYSLSGGKSGFRKGFTEHGMIIGLMAIRQKHSYQQGINRFWTRKKRIDFYDPTFANIGEQPVYRSEIKAGLNTSGVVFGYNEAWADLRYKPDLITGQMRSDSNTGFDTWHFGDYYATAPVLGDSFIKETPAYVDRTIKVPSTTANQFIIDIYIKNEAIRVLPTYSIPGMIDHN